MAAEAIIKDAEDKMKKAHEFLKQEMRKVRTGQASPGLVENLQVHVESYGSNMALRELGNIAVAEGNVLVIKPYDPSTLKDIEKAIVKSDVGINPQNDGKMIRLPVPPLSTERRNQLVDQVKKSAEQQKVAIRNARRDANKALEQAKKDKTLSEDEVKRHEEAVQKMTDRYVKQTDELVEEKQKDIMEV